MSESAAPRARATPAGAELSDRPTIPGFEILRELGRGGMGVVYKARQDASRRLVALKVIRDAALASPEERARFRIEAEAAARMRHPNIIEIHQVGEHQGRPWFAMELVEGGSLDTRLAGRPQPAELAAELIRTLALAVQHAHAQKIVHRDLKPANVLLSAAGGESTVIVEPNGDFPRSICSPLTTADGRLAVVPKIADFGLAKRLDIGVTALTQVGAIVGTPNYMAPEQAAGRAQEVGPAADVYALGAMLYELLAGQPPFQADSLGQTIERVLHDEPTPPARLNPEVPRCLENVCLKCLEKVPLQRYAAAEELADDLARFLSGRPVAARPLDERARLTRLAERDGYQIVEEIGRGPASTVYRAQHGPLKQSVALKVFRVGCCTREEWEDRLQRAADRWATLAHPHIVPIERAGWWDGVPYVAFDYAPQGNLGSSFSGESCPVDQALRLVEQVAEVVQYLHRQGVVHGNLKPGNVLLAADGIPRVSDLHPTGGLFQGTLAPDQAEPSGLASLAPELLRDPDAEPRPHTDIYGLGLILYELLAGRPAFAGSTARDVSAQVLSQDPIPPSRFNSRVTAELDALCLRCLRKNPWRRYSRVYDISKRLRDLLENPAKGAKPGERRPRRLPPGREETPVT